MILPLWWVFEEGAGCFLLAAETRGKARRYGARHVGVSFTDPLSVQRALARGETGARAPQATADVTEPGVALSGRRAWAATGYIGCDRCDRWSESADGEQPCDCCRELDADEGDAAEALRGEGGGER